ncbi:rhomboid family intramembrane serine protease [Chitinophaga pinensis]|uniref:Rhomboid family protein n=1 Tax=Chitinophaga pinensis (strain ATCC 43595 / DSM 2588 / LMG 13176 / NBRC 15968 / NCIMB 11800 / UQM 2034) TaxID=485918 RepID=A0A979G4N2_CHIPD|nr:rhomboid family intramembrane serine protease [Chitinophaga pinensis]ACU60626.1 Rhomboid family protein [Chitinophaga pinensis DSM 2588]
MSNKQYTTAEPQLRNAIATFVNIFLPRKGYLVTPVLIAINFLVFAIAWSCGYDVMKLGPEEMDQLGKHIHSVVQQGEWWWIVAYLFLNGGYIYIIVTTTILFIQGYLFEKYVGTLTFLGIYLAAGIVGNIEAVLFSNISPLFHTGPFGGILGVFGFVTFLMLTQQIKVSAIHGGLIFFVSVLLSGYLKGLDENSVGPMIISLAFGMGFGYIQYVKLKRKKQLSHFSEI